MESRRIYLQGSSGEADIGNRLMDMGKGEERVRCMERVTWKLVLPYVKQIAKGSLLYGSGNPNRGFVSTQRGRIGREMGRRHKREGIYVYLWLIHVEVRQKTTKFCKAIILQLKNKLVKRSSNIDSGFKPQLRHLLSIYLTEAI